MSEVYLEAQLFIQLKEAIKASSNPSTKPNKDEMKSKSTHEALNYVSDRYRGQPPYKKQVLSIITSSPM